MIPARLLGRRSVLSVIALALGCNTAAFATTTYHRTALPPVRPNATHSLSVLHTFTGVDGSAPVGNLDLAVGLSGHTITRTLYGVTEGGGAAFSGSIFSFTLGSNTFGSLYQFTGGNDGGVPADGLANNETNYIGYGQGQLGTAEVGGSGSFGTLFAVSSSGKLTVVHTFTGGADGADPVGRLTQFTDGNFYGTTTGGGLGYGTIYRVTPNGAFSTIYSFTGDADGGTPVTGLALNVNFGDHAHAVRGGTVNEAVERAAVKSPQFVSPYLYGTTSGGGTGGAGTIFRITPTGQLQTLYSFTGGGDGGTPAAKLSSDLWGNLYGSTSGGGVAGNGVIFKLASNSSTPQVIYDFGNGATGAAPQGQITLGFNGNLYGTTSQGGASGQYGSVYEISAAGFSDIYDFAGTDGANPQSVLVDGGDGKLYGTTLNGGANFDGVLFSITE